MKQHIRSSILNLTFDDGLTDQFKWARGMHYGKLRGTFYVNPSTIGDEGHLTFPQLRKMHDEWNHVIANHMWKHGGGMDMTPDEAVESIQKTDAWLVENDFPEGVGILAFPYGLGGGRWGDHLRKMSDAVRQIRDVGESGINDFELPCEYVIAQYDSVPEAFDMLNNLELEKEAHIYALLFHRNPVTFDPYFLKLLNRICELRDEKKLRIVTMQELVDGSL